MAHTNYQYLPSLLTNQDWLYKLDVDVSSDQIEYERSIYGFFDLIGELGGVHGLFI